MRSVAAVAAFAAAVMVCVGGQATAQNYRDFEIGANFTPDPQVGTGHAGGPVEASTFGPGCVGMIDDSPDHVVTVTSTVNLRMYALSAVDTTLVVRGPSGTFCDDDSHGGLNPEINARLAPGRYEVYVGRFGDDTGPYTLTLTENVGAGADEQGPRTFTLGAGFVPDPMTGRGITGGDDYAARFGPGCSGWVHAEPDHVLTVTSAVNLHMYVDSTVDATLVVMGPAGAWCDDDSHGSLDPAIRRRFQPGIYQIYVGHLGEAAGTYQITLTEDLDDFL